jgi:quercetin dioxygenase-like cupin family protein
MGTARILQIRTGEGRESTPGVRVWSASGERMTQNYVELQPGATTSVDRHANEQINYLLRGRLEVTLGPDGLTRQELAPGESVIIPPYVEHRFRVIGDLAAAMVAFLSPARDQSGHQRSDR